jgi:PII-like signaling protein
MQLPQDAVLLRVCIGDNDRHDARPLYEAIVLAAHERGLAGDEPARVRR